MQIIDKRSGSRRRAPIIAVLAAATLVVSGCATNNDNAETSKPNQDTFIMGVTGNIPNLSPQPATSTRFMLRKAVFNTLVDYAEGEPVAELATQWSISDDGLTYELALRDDVTFTNGKQLTGEDVCDNITWAQDLANGVQGAGLLAGIECESAETSVTLSLPQRLPQLLTLMVNMPIMDLSSGTDLESSPVGTGPYMFDDFKPGSEIAMVRNPDYWGEPAVTENFTVKMFSDASSAVVALKGGAVHALFAPPSSQAEDIRNTDGVDLLMLPGYGNYQYNINVTEPPLDNPLVRQAISLAVDRDSFAEITSGIATASDLMWPPSSPAYNSADDHPEFDLDKARELLKKAGYADGFDMDITNSKQSGPEFAEFGPILQSNLAEIGVTANLIDLEASDKSARGLAGEYTGLITNVYAFSNLDPALAFAAQPFAPSGNLSKFDSDEYKTMVTDAQSELDPQKRIEMYREIARFVQEQEFQITVASNQIVFALRDEVENFQTNAYGMPLVNLIRVTG